MVEKSHPPLAFSSSRSPYNLRWDGPETPVRRLRANGIYGPGVKLTLSKVAVPRTDALCEHSKSPAVALVLKVKVFDTTCVQVTPSPDTEAVNVVPNVVPTLVNFIQ